MVEPSGPINVGSVARLCENFEINDLRLVRPQCDPLDPDAIKMAVRGKSLLRKAKTFNSLIDAISDCGFIICTCGRKDHGNIKLHEMDTVKQNLINLAKGAPIGLVFGREDRGLTNKELLLAHKVLSIKTNSNYPSLNLSHAVAIVIYELFHDQSINLETIETHEELQLASPRKINDFLEDTESLLLEIGFLLKHTADARMAKLRTLIQKSQVTTNEVSLIRGILRQVRWAIDNNQPKP